MTKKKKQKSKSKKVKTARQSVPSPSNKLDQLRSAIAAMRGRRAVALTERLDGTTDISKIEWTRLCAIARETRIRELFDDDHPREAIESAKAALKREPAYLDHWSLGIQLRCGLIPDIEARLQDDVWRQRLRREIVSPFDAAGIAAGELGADAEHLLAAWDAASDRREDVALERLKAIGRRSILVDWRLFVQVLAHAQNADPDRADDTFKRIDPNSCAHRLAALALATARSEPASAGIQDKITDQLSDGDPVSGLRNLACRIRREGIEPCVDDVARLARVFHGQCRPGLTATLLATCAHSLTDDDERESFLRQMNRRTPESWRARFRLEYGSHGATRLFPGDAHSWVGEAKASPAMERALILTIAARTTRDEWPGFQDDGAAHENPWGRDTKPPLTEYDEMQVCSMLDQTRKAVHLWPQLLEAYDLWEWAENRQGSDTCKAAIARAEEFPDREDSWERLATAATRCRRTDLFNMAIERLTAFPGAADRCERLRQDNRFHGIVAAYSQNRKDEARTEIALYQTDNPMRRAMIGLIDSMTASNADDTSAAVRRLEAMRTPLIVLMAAEELCADTALNVLPRELRKALDDDPVAVVEDFRVLFAAFNGLPPMTTNSMAFLMRALCNRLVPIESAIDTIFDIIVDPWEQEMDDLVWDWFNDGLFMVSDRLLSSDDPDIQSQGLMIRAFLVDLTDADLDETMLERAQIKVMGAALYFITSETAKQRWETIVRECDLIQKKNIRKASRAMAEKLLKAQQECDDVSMIVNCVQPPGRKLRPAAAVAQPQETGTPALYAKFDLDNFHPMTIIEIETAIDRIRDMPLEQQTLVMKALRERISTIPWCSEASRERLLAKCVPVAAERL